MFKILDALYILTVERSYSFHFTPEQLEEARANEGHVSVRVSGKYFHFKIPIVTLSDLLSCPNDVDEEMNTPW